MMTNIAGIPYVEAEFDKHGAPVGPVAAPAGVTDIFIMSHGWNNNADEARELYRKLFESFVAVAQPNDLPGRTFGIIGVVWPSKKFDELVAVAGVAGSAQGSASLSASDTLSRQVLETKLERMKDTFTEPAARQTLDAAKALIPELEDKASARRDFVEKIRSLLNPAAANREDASGTFFKD